MAGYARRQTAQFRRRRSGSWRTRGFRLQQPNLLVPVLQRRGASSECGANGEVETVTHVAELRWAAYLQILRCARNRTPPSCRSNRLKNNALSKPTLTATSAGAQQNTVVAPVAAWTACSI